MNQYPATITTTPIRELSTLEDEITELAAHINAATYRLLTLIREYDERQGWGGGGLKSCAHWLNWKCGINLGAAREKVRVAHALQHLPHISAALRNGRISFSKVRAITRVATALDIGRRTRSIPPAIRRALDRRDGGCRFPGCTTRHSVDAHHVQHWADGGETRLDNLLLLCRHHHRLVHEGGYGLTIESNEPVFTAPNGKPVPQGPDMRFRGNVFALTTANQREKIDIDAATLVPLWHGDKMDDGMAVDGFR
ncbi:MAG: DUF222 domain-containing protein [Halioglobus sp.]|nr:DUF222 domain-containing protein [Halioglobus sp.]